MLLSIITVSAVSVSAEQGSMTLEYTDPSLNGGTQGDTDHNPDTTQGSNTPGINQSNEHTQSNVKTGDITAVVAGGLSFAVLLSACIACFTFRKKKKAD